MNIYNKKIKYNQNKSKVNQKQKEKIINYLYKNIIN